MLSLERLGFPSFINSLCRWEVLQILILFTASCQRRQIEGVLNQPTIDSNNCELTSTELTFTMGKNAIHVITIYFANRIRSASWKIGCWEQRIRQSEFWIQIPNLTQTKCVPTGYSHLKWLDKMNEYLHVVKIQWDVIFNYPLTSFHRDTKENKKMDNIFLIRAPGPSDSLELIHLNTEESGQHTIIIIAVIGIKYYPPNMVCRSLLHHRGPHIININPHYQHFVVLFWKEYGQSLQNISISGLREVEIPGNIGNINSHPFNLLTFSPHGYTIFIPSIGPHQPQLRGHCRVSGKKQSGSSPQIGES